MNIQEAMRKTMDDYRRITGLRSYLILDSTVIESASERNYFCKCLKSSTKALHKCEECTHETYTNAREIDKECIYSCHAGMIKWAVPVSYHNFHCVIISEGILAQKQIEEADVWSSYLAKEYNLSKDMLLNNLKNVQTMDEKQMNASITLLKDLVAYYLKLVSEKELTAV